MTARPATDSDQAILQSQGVGSRILKKLQLQAAARNVPLQLGAFRTNTLAQKLYEKSGI